MLFVSKSCYDFGHAIIETYENWSQYQYEFVNEHTGDRIWTSNGSVFIQMRGHKAWGMFEKAYINKCIQTAKTLKILKSK